MSAAAATILAGLGLCVAVWLALLLRAVWRLAVDPEGV